jgi:hypothetical protein
MHSIGEHQLFRDVIFEFEILGINILFSMLGSFPTFENYFDFAHGITTYNL